MMQKLDDAKKYIVRPEMRECAGRQAFAGGPREMTAQSLIAESDD